MIEKDRIIRATGAKAPMRLVVIDLTRAANEMASRLGAKSYPAKLLAETLFIVISSLFTISPQQNHCISYLLICQSVVE